MLVDAEQAKLWLKQYQVQDLSRSLLREFLIQSQMFNTLNTFESEDKRKYKKISKATLIKMLSMNNLVFYNKNADRPYKSLLEILVAYLKDKFKGKVLGNNDESFKKSDMSNLDLNKDSVSERNKLQKSLNHTENLREEKSNKANGRVESYKLVQKQHAKERPKTSKKPNQNIQYIYAELEKQKERQKTMQQLQKAKQQQERKKRAEQEHRRKKQQQERERKRKQEEQREMKRKQEEKQRIEQQERRKQREQRLKKEERDKQQARLREEQKRREEEQLRKEQEQRIAQQKYKQQKERIQREERIRKQKEQQQRRKLEQEQAKIEEEYEKQQQQQSNSNIEIQEIKQQAKPLETAPQMKVERSNKMRKLLKKTDSNQVINDEANKSNEVALKKQSSNIQEEAPTFILGKNEETPPPLKKEQPEEKVETQPKMMKMFGKKKKNDQSEEVEQNKKFKFDENFVDEPLRGQEQKYQYQKIKFNEIIIKNEQKGEINYKQKFLPGSKKFPEKSITQQQTLQLKKAVFQSGPTALPKSWYQGFILSPYPTTSYGLQQIQGGPCGIIAAVQCFYLKHLLYLSHPQSEEQLSNQTLRQNCLVAAITDILFKVKSADKIYLTLPPKSFSGTKIDFSNIRIVIIDATSFSQAFQGLWQHKAYFIGKSNHGVAFLMYSIVMTKGIQKIWQQMDIPENPLIGNHGHCTQELVNLFITGQASSNCFDDHKVLDSQLKLKGIQSKAQFGFLTIFETLKYIEVGKNLKNPKYPFWIICKQFHYHVIFANHYLIAQNNNTPKFDIVYFDGLYNCGDRIVITLQNYPYGEELEVKVKDLPLIEQVMMTKWGARKADWNGSIKIL